MDKRTIYSLAIFLLGVIASDVNAQTLKGKVADNEGKPIPGAVVFIREISQGIATDDNGEFRIDLKNGNYICEFSSLGYEKKAITVVINNPLQSVSVLLEKKVYELGEVVISARREDPAYAIMRKAIAMAPYYLHQVKGYESEIYLKGSMKLNKIAGLIESRVDKMKLIKGSLFIKESKNEVIFTSPDKYEQKVIALSSSFPNGMIDEDSPMSLITANIYAPNVRGIVSPLSPDAFTYYKFVFEGKTEEGKHEINKIRVEPKKNSPMLMRGRLYIVSDSWNVRSLEMSLSMLGISERFTINYSEVRPSVFLPVAYGICDSINIGLIGLDAEVKYYSSVKYGKVDVNKLPVNILSNENIAVKTEDTLYEKTKTGKQAEAERKLEALTSKTNLSNRDAVKIAKLMRETTEPEESKKKRKALEISSRKDNVHVSVDSIAKLRDSAYWIQARNLPLRNDEIVSYGKKDSLNLEFARIRTPDSDGRPAAWPRKIIAGSHTDFGKNYRLRYGGLLRTVPEYNFVDGLWLGHRLDFEIDFSKKYSLDIYSSAYYVTARQTVNWRTGGVFAYAPLRNGKFTASGGNSTFDFNQIGGGSRLVNSLFSLFGGHNSIKFFQKRYIAISNRIDAANGFFVTANAGYERRNILENNTSYNFFGKEPSPNLPDGQLLSTLDNTLTKVAVMLEYTPRYRYRIRDGKKRYVGSKYPSFTLNYEKGVATDSDRSASFDKAELGIRQEISFNIFTRFEYFANTGTFLSSKRVYFPDFKHCNSNALFVTTNPLRNSFCMANYSYSTDKSWFQMHLNYTSAYLFVKNIPFMQKYLFEESLYARTLFVPGTNYSELGYSIGFPKIIEAGVFVGFKKGKYSAAGFTLSLPLNF
jgi:hypothetical protein